MNGNICPQCGQSVMPYKRFIREAEPYKVSECGSCGITLKRSPKVYMYLLMMLILLAALSIPLFIAMAEIHVSFWIMWLIAAVWLVSWIILINYLSWRYGGWVVYKKDNT